MRNVVFISAGYCRACRSYRKSVIEPLRNEYPDNVEVHVGHDAKIAEVNARHRISHVPLIVVEKDGVEEFRMTAMPTFDELADIIECEAVA